MDEDLLASIRERWRVGSLPEEVTMTTRCPAPPDVKATLHMQRTEKLLRNKTSYGSMHDLAASLKHSVDSETVVLRCMHRYDNDNARKELQSQNDEEALLQLRVQAKQQQVADAHTRIAEAGRQLLELERELERQRSAAEEPMEAAASKSEKAAAGEPPTEKAEAS